jgi:hypothetical protein
MSKRKANVVMLCEDTQHEAFLRRVLYHYGWKPRQLRINKCLEASQDAKQYIRSEYPKEVREIRRRNWMNLCLYVVIDADTDSVDDLKRELDSCLTDASPKLEKRSPSDRIVILVPKRNIETWIHYLFGNSVDEITVYPKLKYESDCDPAVQRFHEMCPNNMPGDAPNSLKIGCEELKRCLA